MPLTYNGKTYADGAADTPSVLRTAANGWNGSRYVGASAAPAPVAAPPAAAPQTSGALTHNGITYQPGAANTPSVLRTAANGWNGSVYTRPLSVAPTPAPAAAPPPPPPTPPPPPPAAPSGGTGPGTLAYSQQHYWAADRAAHLADPSRWGMFGLTPTEQAGMTNAANNRAAAAAGVPPPPPIAVTNNNGTGVPIPPAPTMAVAPEGGHPRMPGQTTTQRWAGAKAPTTREAAARQWLEWIDHKYGTSSSRGGGFADLPPGVTLEQALQAYRDDTGATATYVGGSSGDKVDFGFGVVDAQTGTGQLWWGGEGAPGGGAAPPRPSGGGGGGSPAPAAPPAPGGPPGGYEGWGDLLQPWDTPFVPPNRNQMPGPVLYGSDSSYPAFAPPQGTPGYGQGSTAVLPDFDAPDVPTLPGFRAPTMEEVQGTPGYEFRRNEGITAREHMGARQGITRTLGLTKELERYGQDYASQEYEKEYARRAGEYDRLYDQTMGVYDRRFSNAAAEYQPNVLRYNTETAAGQRQEELDYNRAWAEYLQDYQEWYKHQQSVFDRLKWQSEFGLDAARS
jgi:hypothetical protein